MNILNILWTSWWSPCPWTSLMCPVMNPTNTAIQCVVAEQYEIYSMSFLRVLCFPENYTNKMQPHCPCVHHNAHQQTSTINARQTHPLFASNAARGWCVGLPWTASLHGTWALDLTLQKSHDMLQVCYTPTQTASSSRLSLWCLSLWHSWKEHLVICTH